MTADSALYTHNQRQLMRPASCMKLVTAITALDRLGSDYDFQTRIYYTGNVIDSTLVGNIYCLGGFDPTLTVDDVREFFRHILERIDLKRDLHFQSRASFDTIDYSAVDGLNNSSKLVIAAAGKPIRKLPRGPSCRPRRRCGSRRP